MPRSFTSSALASAIRYRGILTAPVIASAILCMVLVHNTTKSVLFDPTCRLCQRCSRLFPTYPHAGAFDPGEGNAVHHSFGRMMTALSRFDRLVDYPTVDGRGFSAHLVDHADSTHPEILLKLEGPNVTSTGLRSLFNVHREMDASPTLTAESRYKAEKHLTHI